MSVTALVCLFLALSTTLVAAAPKAANGFTYLGEYTAPSSGIGALGTTTSHYYLSRAKVEWGEANFACQNIFQDGALVALETAAENTAVRNLVLKENLEDEYLWTAGAYDGLSSAFRWTSTGGFADIDNFGRWAVGHPIRSKNYRMIFVNSLFSSQTQWATSLAWPGSYAYVCESSS